MQKVRLDQIDFEDKTFSFKDEFRDEELISHIGKFGLLSPVGLLLKNTTAKKKYCILYGFKRIYAAADLKLKEVYAQIFSNLEKRELIEIILLENRNSNLSHLEKAGLLTLMKKILSLQDEDLQRLWNEKLPLQHISLKEVGFYLRLNDAPAPIKEALIKQQIDINKAELLLNIPSEISNGLLLILQNCEKISYAQLKILLELIEEIMLIDNIKSTDIPSFIKSLLSYIKKKQRSKRYDELYKKLFSHRYPEFSKYMNEYKQIRREITRGIPKEYIDLTTHPYFEEDNIKITLKVNNTCILSDILNRLLEAIDDGRFNKIFCLLNADLTQSKSLAE